MKKKSKKIKNARALPIKLDFIKPVHLKKLMFKMVLGGCGGGCGVLGFGLG